MISAYTATTRIEGFANSFGDSGAEAMSVFVAQNTGAGQAQRVRAGFRTGLGLLVGLGLVMSVVLFATAQGAVSLLAAGTTPITLEHGSDHLHLIAVFYILCFMGNGFVGYFRGSGQVRIPVYGTLIQISLRVALSYALITRMGLAGVALATGIGWVVVVCFHGLMWRRRAGRPPLPHTSG